jgi:ATP-binding cassette subfamily B protein
MDIPEPTRRRHIRHARRRARSRAMSRYAGKPLSLLWRYIARRKVSHLIVLTSVVAAVGCALAAQYGIKNLVDALPSGRGAAPPREARPGARIPPT